MRVGLACDTEVFILTGRLAGQTGVIYDIQCWPDGMRYLVLLDKDRLLRTWVGADELRVVGHT